MDLLKEGLHTPVRLLEDLVSRCKENLNPGLPFLLFASAPTPYPELMQRVLAYFGNTLVHLYPPFPFFGMSFFLLTCQTSTHLLRISWVATSSRKPSLIALFLSSLHDHC